MWPSLVAPWRPNLPTGLVARRPAHCGRRRRDRQRSEGQVVFVNSRYRIRPAGRGSRPRCHRGTELARRTVARRSTSHSSSAYRNQLFRLPYPAGIRVPTHQRSQRLRRRQPDRRSPQPRHRATRHTNGHLGGRQRGVGGSRHRAARAGRHRRAARVGRRSAAVRGRWSAEVRAIVRHTPGESTPEERCLGRTESRSHDRRRQDRVRLDVA